MNLFSWIITLGVLGLIVWKIYDEIQEKREARR